MPQFAASLTMMFNEVPFLQRFRAAAQAGYKAVEFLSQYDRAAEEIAQQLKTNGVENVLCELGHDGWIGCEYRPAKGTVEGLRWMKGC